MNNFKKNTQGKFSSSLYQLLIRIEKWIERHSTTLEVLGVVAIPLGLFFVAQSYQENLRRQEMEQLQQQALTDYLNQLSTIMLEMDSTLHDPQNKELRTLMTATTLTLLRDPNLDGARKGQVIEFLSQMNLVQSQQLEDIAVVSLSGANLSGADLDSADFSNADLSDADLGGADLSDADLSNADLSSTDLGLANLSSADFSNADLSGADFSNADLSLASLSGADLGGANFTDADLSSVNFGGADFSRDPAVPILSQGNKENSVILNGVNLRGADLSAAIDLEQSQIQYAQLCATRLPLGINLDPDRDCRWLEGYRRAPLWVR